MFDLVGEGKGGGFRGGGWLEAEEREKKSWGERDRLGREDVDDM